MSFSIIPHEVLVEKIFSHLSASEIESVHKTHRDLRNVVKDPVFAKALWDAHWEYCSYYVLDSSKKRHFYLKDSKLEGEYKVFSNKGVLLQKSFYKEGEQVGLHQEWYANGKMKKELYYVDGVIEGKVKKWFDNGNLKSLSTMEQGLITGLATSWFSSGRKESEIMYANGKQDGYARAWNEEGGLEREYLYKNGEQEGRGKTWHTIGEQVLCSELWFENGIRKVNNYWIEKE